MLQIKEVYHSFQDAEVLNNINLDIDDAEHFFILGPSGCGKSTLLKIISGLLTPSEGSIILNGENLTTVPPERRPIHMIFQNYALFPHLSVNDNIAFPLKLAGVSVTDRSERIKDALALVKLSGYENRKINQLSGGEQQRVAIARALVNRPKVLLLDEPLSAIDEQLKRQLLLDLKEIKCKTNTIFIHVTHHQEEAFSLADRIAVMGNGKILQIGTPETIYKHPVTKQVASFIGRINFLHMIEQNNSFRLIDMPEIKPVRDNIKNGQPHKLFLGIRPENIRIAKNESELPNGLTYNIGGHIINRIFGGGMVELQVSTSAGLISTACTFEEAALFSDDELVSIGWKQKDSILFSDTDQS